MICQSNTKYKSAFYIPNNNHSSARLTTYSPKFWAKLGPELRELQLVDCYVPSEILYCILRKCPKLESFELEGKFLDIQSPIETIIGE